VAEQKRCRGRVCARWPLAVRSGFAQYVSTMNAREFARQTANGKRQTANGKRQTANGKRQTANGKRQTAND
jgi:hypothetical protein